MLKQTNIVVSVGHPNAATVGAGQPIVGIVTVVSRVGRRRHRKAITDGIIGVADCAVVGLYYLGDTILIVITVIGRAAWISDRFTLSIASIAIADRLLIGEVDPAYAVERIISHGNGQAIKQVTRTGVTVGIIVHRLK